MSLSSAGFNKDFGGFGSGERKTLVFEEFSEAGEKDRKTASRQFWQFRIPLTHLSAECGDEGMSHPSLRVRLVKQLLVSSPWGG